MSDEERFHAFLSYASRPDERVARALEAWLEKFHESAPAESRPAALRICRDGSDFQLGGKHTAHPDETVVQATLRHYLSRSEYLIILCSKGAVASPHVEDELRLFLAHALPTGKPAADRVILAVTEGRRPELTPEQVFPAGARALGLHERIWVDLRGGDWLRRWRAGQSRDYEEERLGLVARLYNVSVDSISPYWYRQQRRRNRRQIAALATVLTVVAALAVGMFFFWRSAVESERRVQDNLHLALAERYQPEDVELSAAHLLEVARPDQTPRWAQRVQEHLRIPVADAVWSQETPMRLVGSLEAHGNTVLAYGLLNRWYIFPPDRPTGCAVGFTSGDPLGAPMISASQPIAFLQHQQKLFRFPTICADGNRDGTSQPEPRPLVGLWDDRPILAEPDGQFVAALPENGSAAALRWKLPFPCATRWAPLIQKNRVLMLCGGGDVIALTENGRVSSAVAPAPCKGAVTSAARHEHGMVYSTGKTLCAVSLAGGSPSIRELRTLPDNVSLLAANTPGTVVVATTGSPTVYRTWLDTNRAEDIPFEQKPKEIAVDSEGLLAALSPGKIEWVSSDGTMRASRMLPQTYVHGAMFLPDGRLVVALDDETLRVWNRSSLKAALSLQAQLIHFRLTPDGASLLVLTRNRLAVVHKGTGTLRVLPPDRQWDEFTQRTGFLTGLCPGSEPRLCWFDAHDAQSPGLPLESSEAVSQSAVDFDAASGRLAWYANNRLYLHQRQSSPPSTLITSLNGQELGNRAQLQLMPGGRIAILFSHPDADPPVAQLVRAELVNGKLVAAPPEQKASTLSLLRVAEDGWRGLCELQRDGWADCSAPELRFRLPDSVFQTPAGAVLAKLERQPSGIARVDADRFVVWTSDRACAFRRGSPEVCRPLGYAGTNIKSVAAQGDDIVIGTLNDTILVYSLRQVEAGNSSPRHVWNIGQVPDQMLLQNGSVWIGGSHGLIGLPLAHHELRARLAAKAGLCLFPGQRVLELGETEEVAQQRYRQCARSYAASQ